LPNSAFYKLRSRFGKLIVCFVECADSWFQVAFVLTTGINSAYVLGYSGTIMVPLGWIGGVVGLLIATAISLYANTLIAKLHEFGGRRHIRYRDLAGFIYGKKDQTSSLNLLYVSLLCCYLHWNDLSFNQVGRLIILHGDCNMLIFS